MKPSRVDKLADAGRGYARIWQDFVKSYQENPDVLYCFFEGLDDPRYYGSRIDGQVFNGQEPSRQNLWCKGKGNLIELYELVVQSPRHNNAWVAFFLDKDFDDLEELPESELVYITPCYSVENLYIDISVFSRILQDEFAISPADEDYSSTINLFQENLRQFNDASEELNSWIYLQRKREKTNPSTSRINLQNVSFDRLFSVNIEGVKKLYVMSTLETAFPECLNLFQGEIEKQVEYFRQHDRTEIFRGKYLISFLSKLLTLLVDDSHKREDREHFSIRRNVPMRLSSNTVSELSQYAKTPKSLIDFLSKVRERRPQLLRVNSKTPNQS